MCSSVEWQVPPETPPRELHMTIEPYNLKGATLSQKPSQTKTRAAPPAETVY
jgi:hypothetical protein